MKTPCALILIAAFLFNGLGPFPAQAQGIAVPSVGSKVFLSLAFTPAHLQGMTINPKEPFQFEFLVHRSDDQLTNEQKKEEYKKLVGYFLAALTVPEKDQWVNLSPYERNRIVEDGFGKTEMGRDLLAQDYLLKQITSSLMYPESGLGKKFWDEIYRKAGNVQVPVNTFNKVWIVPDEAVVYESGGSAYILKSHLKVMLEKDYLAQRNNATGPVPAAPRQSSANSVLRADKGFAFGPPVASKIIRKIILPALEREVNEGKNFAQLRQVYSGMILATWYKRSLKESILNKIYADQSKIDGINLSTDALGLTAQKIYEQYLLSVKKGVFNYIKEEEDQHTHQLIPRKYFAGGFAANPEMVKIIGEAKLTRGDLIDFQNSEARLDKAEVSLRPTIDAAMSASVNYIGLFPVMKNIEVDVNAGRYIPALASLQEVLKRFTAHLTPDDLVGIEEYKEKVLDLLSGNVVGYIKAKDFDYALYLIKIYRQYSHNKDKINFLRRLFWVSFINEIHHFFQLTRYHEVELYLTKSDDNAVNLDRLEFKGEFEKLQGRLERIRSLGEKNIQVAYEILGIKRGEDVVEAYQKTFKEINHSSAVLSVKKSKMSQAFQAYKWLLGYSATKAWDNNDIELLQLRHDVADLRKAINDLDQQILRLDESVASAQGGERSVQRDKKRLLTLQDQRLEAFENLQLKEKKLRNLDPINGYDAAMIDSKTASVFKAKGSDIHQDKDYLKDTLTQLLIKSGWFTALQSRIIIEQNTIKIILESKEKKKFLLAQMSLEEGDISGPILSSDADRKGTNFYFRANKEKAIKLLIVLAYKYLNERIKNPDAVIKFKSIMPPMKVYLESIFKNDTIPQIRIGQFYALRIKKEPGVYDIDWKRLEDSLRPMTFGGMMTRLNASIAQAIGMSNPAMSTHTIREERIGKGILKTGLSVRDLKQIKKKPTKYYAISFGQKTMIKESLKPWDIVSTPLDVLNQRMQILPRIRELLKKYGADYKVTILDWGIGDGVGMFELAEYLKKQHIKFEIIGFSDTYFDNWKNAPEGIIFILDDAQHLGKYGLPKIDLGISHYGLLHAYLRTGFRTYTESEFDLLDDIQGMLKSDGIFRMYPSRSVPSYYRGDRIHEVYLRKDESYDEMSSKAMISRRSVLLGLGLLATGSGISQIPFGKIADYVTHVTDNSITYKVGDVGIYEVKAGLSGYEYVVAQLKAKVVKIEQDSMDEDYILVTIQSGTVKKGLAKTFRIKKGEHIANFYVDKAMSTHVGVFQYLLREMVGLEEGNLATTNIEMSSADIVKKFFNGRKVLNIGPEENNKIQWGLLEENIMTFLRDNGIDAWALSPGLVPAGVSWGDYLIRGFVERMDEKKKNGRPLVEDDQFDDVVIAALFDPVYWENVLGGFDKMRMEQRQSLYPIIAQQLKRIIRPGGRLFMVMDRNNNTLLVKQLQQAGFQLSFSQGGGQTSFADGKVFINTKKDSAQITAAPGGIDMNSTNMTLTIKRDGRGMPLPFANQDLSQFNHIQGFQPIIIEIAPVTGTIPILSELRQKKQALQSIDTPS